MLNWALKWRYVLLFLTIGAGVVLQSADPGTYPWAPYAAGATTLIFMAGVAASLVYQRSRRGRPYDPLASMTRDTQRLKFDGGNWVKVARFAVAASVVLSAAMVAILPMFDPPNQCPNWHLKDAASTSLWELLALWTTPLMVFGCFIAVRWNWVARKGAETDGRELPTSFGPMIVPVTYVMIPMCVANSVLSQFPLFLLVTACTDWLRL
jgi:hypothetical protein